MKNYQDGFSALEVILAVVILGIVGLAGWYVVARDGNDQSATTSQSQDQDQKVTDACGTSNQAEATRQVATSSENSFSMCVPGGWTLLSDTQSENFTVSPPFTIVEEQPAVVKVEEKAGGDGSKDMLTVFKAEESYQGWTLQDAEKTTFTLNDGTTGIRYYTKHSGVGEGIGPVEGEEDYEYLFEKNGKFIHAVYVILPGTQKQLETVESVLKTLLIN